jgi:hypothetical protein
VIALLDAIELYVQEGEPPPSDPSAPQREPVIAPVLPGDITARYT